MAPRNRRSYCPICTKTFVEITFKYGVCNHCFSKLNLEDQKKLRGQYLLLNIIQGIFFVFFIVMIIYAAMNANPDSNTLFTQFFYPINSFVILFWILMALFLASIVAQTSIVKYFYHIDASELNVNTESESIQNPLNIAISGEDLSNSQESLLLNPDLTIPKTQLGKR